MARKALKCTKYGDLAVSHTFVGVVIETLGVWGQEAVSLVGEIGRRQAACTGELRSGLFLRQRIGIALQRGNAISVLGTIKLPPLPGEEGGAEAG